MPSKFQTKVKKEMEAQGYKVLKLITLSENGYPDLMCLKNGAVVFIECKEKNDTLKPLQKLRIKELRDNGFEAYCLQDGKGRIF
jgi:Holliday junction resolvase